MQDRLNRETEQQVVAREDEAFHTKHEDFMNIPGVRFLCQIILGETFEPLTLMLARRNPPLRSISVGNVLVASDFASLLSNGYVGERVIQAHQELLNRTTTRVHFMVPTAFADLRTLDSPPWDSIVPNLEGVDFLAWPVHITPSHWAGAIHGSAPGSPVYYIDSCGTPVSQRARAKMPNYPQYTNICDVINKLGARVHPPRRWAEMFTWLEVPPQQGQDCAVCVNDMFWRFAENPEQFLGSRDFWFDGVQLRIQQAKLLYDSCL